MILTYTRARRCRLARAATSSSNAVCLTRQSTQLPPGCVVVCKQQLRSGKASASSGTRLANVSALTSRCLCKLRSPSLTRTARVLPATRQVRCASTTRNVRLRADKSARVHAAVDALLRRLLHVFPEKTLQRALALVDQRGVSCVVAEATRRVLFQARSLRVLPRRRACTAPVPRACGPAAPAAQPRPVGARKA